MIRQKTDTTADYFLAGRHLGWLIVGASIFASNIGAEHLVGLAGAGATDGVAMAHYELHAWCLLVLGWVMVPFYMRSQVFTMPEFLERRFSGLRTVLSLIPSWPTCSPKSPWASSPAASSSASCSPRISFMGLMTVSGWARSVMIFTGVYTAMGGMRAVAYTEALQTMILVLGSRC